MARLKKAADTGAGVAGYGASFGTGRNHPANKSARAGRALKAKYA